MLPRNGVGDRTAIGGAAQHLLPAAVVTDVRTLVLTALALLVAAPAAAADPPWSAPRDASPVVGFVTSPGIVFGADGSALLSWNDGEHAEFATLGADGAIAQRGGLTGTLVARPLIIGGSRTVILIRNRRVTGRFRTLDQLTATFGTTASPRGRARRVGGSHEVFGEDQGPAMAVSEGEVAVAWVELLSHERHRYRIAFSRGGRAFSRPQTLATTGLPTRDSESIVLAYGPKRELVAAYASARRKDGSRPVIAVHTRRPGHGFGRARILGERRPLTDLAAASANGRVVVAWGSQDSGEEAGHPWTVRAALRGPGRRFGRAAVLDPGATRDRVPGHLAAVMTRDGTATLAWTNVVGDSFPLRTATAAPGARFGQTAQLSPNGVVGGLAVDRGATLLTWTDAQPDVAEPPPRDVFAALRPAGAAAFGAPERVSTAAFDDFDPAAAAFDPQAGRPTVLWPAGPDAAGIRLQISSRAG